MKKHIKTENRIFYNAKDYEPKSGEAKEAFNAWELPIFALDDDLAVENDAVRISITFRNSDYLDQGE